jgi:Putative transposase
MSLAASEFIRRFLLHVLPSGLQRIRHYGSLANRHRAEKLLRCRQLLAVPVPIVDLPMNRSTTVTAMSSSPAGRCGIARSVVKVIWCASKSFCPVPYGPRPPSRAGRRATTDELDHTNPERFASCFAKRGVSFARLEENHTCRHPFARPFARNTRPTSDVSAKIQSSCRCITIHCAITLAH